MRLGLVLILALGAPAVAVAQQQPAQGRPEVASVRPAQEPHPVGQYAGVVPGEARQPSHVAARTGAPPVLLTWPGFQGRQDGASRIFIQTSAPVQYEARAEPGRYVILFHGLRVPVRNNGRTLETRFFNSPVTRARIERRRRDVALVLELRADITPTVSVEAGASGYQFLFVTFSAGNYLPPELAAPPPEVEQAQGGLSTVETLPRRDAPPPAQPGQAAQPGQPPPFRDAEQPPALQGRAGP